MNEFENDVKTDIIRYKLSRACCRRTLLSGLLWGAKSSGRMYFKDNKCLIGFDNAPSLKILCQYMRQNYHILMSSGINRKSRRKHFFVCMIHDDRFNQVLNEIGIMNESLEFLNVIPSRIVKSSCCRVSFIKGAFLSTGSIRDPNKGYYAEFRSYDESLLNYLQKMLEPFHIMSHFFYDKYFPVLFLKESDHIVSLLSLLGAHHNLLKIEDIRLIKEIKNEVNRAVNCDAYNTKRTVEAAQRHIAAIKKAERNIGMNNLPNGIQDIAKLRLDHPMASLNELSNFTKNRISRSAINNRFRRLEKIVNGK